LGWWWTRFFFLLNRKRLGDRSGWKKRPRWGRKGGNKPAASNGPCGFGVCVSQGGERAGPPVGRKKGGERQKRMGPENTAGSAGVFDPAGGGGARRPKNSDPKFKFLRRPGFPPSLGPPADFRSGGRGIALAEQLHLFIWQGALQNGPVGMRWRALRGPSLECGRGGRGQFRSRPVRPSTIGSNAIVFRGALNNPVSPMGICRQGFGFAGGRGLGSGARAATNRLGGCRGGGSLRAKGPVSGPEFDRGRFSV